MTLHELHQWYMGTLIPALEGACVKRLRGFPDWMERCQTARVIAWQICLDRWQEGEELVKGHVVEDAIRRTAGGRDIRGMRAKRWDGDAIEPKNRPVHGAGMESVRDRFDPQGEMEAREEMEHFLRWVRREHGPRAWRIAKSLHKGLDNTAMSQRFKMTASAVSQWRRKITDWLLAWIRRQ